MRIALRLTASAAVVGTLFGSIALPPQAHACGGFFCDNSQPVNQAAERIIFSTDAEGVVTATIQIQYSGNADSFAWVLPVAGRPEVRVSSNLAFQRLQAATNPRYVLITRVEGTCRSDDSLFGPPRSSSDSFFSDASASFSADAGSPVAVVGEGTVGPYDYVIISVDPSRPSPSDVAVEWLRTNGYQIDASGAELLTPYLAGGMNLLAFRLTKGNSVGSIRPVQIVFGRGQASIPIRPTAVAAVEDMGVLVWVLGPHRAIPANYLSLELNEALINWFSPGSNYDFVVTRAANEAGGQGFVTEMAGPAGPLADTIYGDGEAATWQSYRTRDWTGQEGELLVSVVENYAAYDGMRDVLAATVPLPTDRPGTTYEDLLACITCFYGWRDGDIENFEPTAFLASMQTHVIEPMERTRELFERSAYMTRLYTTMSASEMTRDPAFDFNPTLGDYSNVHNAERIIECSPSVSQFEAPWRVEIPGGPTVRGVGSNWPIDARTTSLPANERLVRYDTTGPGEVVLDNRPAIAASLAELNARIVATGGGVAARGGGGLCAAAPGSRAGGSAGLLLALASLVLAWRRRR